MFPRVGGSFAPPLPSEKLARYAALADAAPGPVASGMRDLIRMAAEWHKAPPVPADAAGTPHPSGRGTVVPLPEGEVERLWDVVPWDHEIEGLRPVFDAIDPAAEPELRNAAFHLLWLARELFLDRVPMTADRI